MTKTGGLPQGTSQYNLPPSPIPEWKQRFFARLQGKTHEQAICVAESQDEITFLMNHANEIRPQFSGLLRRRLLRVAVLRRSQLRNAQENPIVLSEKDDSTGGK